MSTEKQASHRRSPKNCGAAVLVGTLDGMTTPRTCGK
jgi:hypothetical protein